MRNQFDEMLEQLNTELIQMGSLCEDAITNSTKLLCRKDGSVEKAAAIEDEINSMERSIEAMCMKLLLRQQPVARDLRQISSALKMISDLERIGDQALDIAEVARFINAEKTEKNQHLEEMAQAVTKMLNRAIDAFVKKDLQMAYEVMKFDDVVDDLFELLKNEVIRGIGEQRENGEYLADVLMAAKYFERIGDHTVNLAEWVVYSIMGRHPKVSEN